MQTNFSARLIAWQRQHGRHHLPWQTREPYRIWLSEIMLQQTQVATVLDYYPRFVAAFPDVASLATAEIDEVLHLWAGLGYYSRARNLHKAAKQVMNEFGGQFPQTRLELEKLCGVGRSTASAIAAFAFEQRETILDGNVKRVLCRVFAQAGDPSNKAFEAQLWQLAESLLPSANQEMPTYTQGLMDLGATVCKRSKPLCHICPMQAICLAHQQNRTAELPLKKQAIKVQHLPLFWLIIRTADGIVLEKRPNKGIWANLYCVPTFTDLASLYQAAAAFGISPDELQEQSSFTHRLTHRLLEITPFEIVLSGEHADKITPYSRVQQLGLPKPLHAYLQKLV
ncbi:MAG: A/G-specific adenine glycosylase [Neisseria sp.]|nr:A/G-specific adenine glycosylase [Neisseria sp.]